MKILNCFSLSEYLIGGGIIEKTFLSSSGSHNAILKYLSFYKFLHEKIS